MNDAELTCHLIASPLLLVTSQSTNALSVITFS
jgi:hypothetical protein